jgi:hypothetical protein
MMVYWAGLCIAGLVKPWSGRSSSHWARLTAHLSCFGAGRFVVARRGPETMRANVCLATDLIKMDPGVGFSQVEYAPFRNFRKEQVRLTRRSM